MRGGKEEREGGREQASREGQCRTPVLQIHLAIARMQRHPAETDATRSVLDRFESLQNGPAEQWTLHRDKVSDLRSEEEV